jgi:cyclophilin family peptidyl-prolyl cis-trans isomerase/HEAT repeat protein
MLDARARVAERRPDRRLARDVAAAAFVLTLVGCAPRTPAPVSAPAPVVAPAAPVIPPVTWQQKIGWIVRLEDQRLLRDPNPDPAPADSPPAAAQPSDLVGLLSDREPQVRARAALALGRVGLSEGTEPLVRLLGDADAEVRLTAAFALGLIGDDAARAPLRAALSDASPLVQGRAAEALALIGQSADAQAIADMVGAHVQKGVLSSVDPDDLDHPLSPPIEAARLGIHALARLGAYEPLASAILGTGGQPVSRWWPLAFALQRTGDARAVPALVALLDPPGRYTASFAAKGLGRMPPPQAVSALQRVVEQRRAHPMVVVQAIRSLVSAGVSDAVPVLLKIVRDPAANPVLRSEAVGAVCALGARSTLDLLRDWLTDPSVDTRAAATRGLARADPDAFIFAVANLDPDSEWRVRVAQAEALGTLPDGRGVARLRTMLGDRDARVVPAVLAALVIAKAPDAEPLARERLQAADVAVRAAAATALGDLKAAASVPALVAAYRAAKGDTTYVARAAALAAVDRIDRQASRPLLAEALGDADWAVRVRAAALLREQGAAGSAETMRPAAAGKPVEDPAWQRIVSPPFTPRAYIQTTKGTIEVELAVTDAPLTAHNFMTLARKGFFNGLGIHRVVADFVVQGGDPRGDGEGGPGYTIRDEINMKPYLRGTVGMALDWEDTGGSQFFITHSPQPHLDARYTVFGRVITGIDVVDRLTTADVIESVRVRDGVSEP